MQDAIMTAAKQSNPVKRRILDWAREAGTKGNVARMSGLVAYYRQLLNRGVECDYHVGAM